MKTHTTNLTVTGMTCSNCTMSVERALRGVHGVTSATVSAATNTAIVEATHAIAPLQLTRAVEQVGYHATVTENQADSMAVVDAAMSDEYHTLLKQFWTTLPFALGTMVLGMLMLDEWNIVQLLLTLPVVWIGGKGFFVAAWNATRHRIATMDTLVAVGTGSAFVYSTIATIAPDIFHGAGEHPHVYFDTTVTIITLILLGSVLEARAKHKTADAMRSLLAYRPTTARVVRSGFNIDVPIDEVELNDTLVIRPGERIATDARIIRGTTTVDEAMLTGESMPVARTEGDVITGGTMNLTGSVKAVAIRVGDATVLQQILRIVERAQASKAPIQRLADRISGWFVPAVIIIAIATFVVWFNVLPVDQRTAQALINMVSVLIIACPCALGLATPTAIMVGTGKGAQAGLIIRNAEALENAHRTTMVVLDKTGTITEGRPTVTDVHIEPTAPSNILSLVATVEVHSEHPLAHAIVAYAKEHDTPVVELNSIEVIAGKGVIATVESHRIVVGNDSLLNDEAIVVTPSAIAMGTDWRERAATVLHVAVDGRYAASFAIADKIRGTSKEAITSLKKMGLRVAILSGDNQQTVGAVALQVGVDEWYGSLLPADKIDVVTRLQNEGERIAMVGDGINDAPALAQANVGIAIGGGTDVAMEAADITLVKSDLQGVARVVRLSRATMKNIKQNLFFAFVYNVLGIPIAAGVLIPAFGIRLDPALAAIAMGLSSVSVITNALRLRTFNFSN